MDELGDFGRRSVVLMAGEVSASAAPPEEFTPARDTSTHAIHVK